MVSKKILKNIGVFALAAVLAVAPAAVNAQTGSLSRSIEGTNTPGTNTPPSSAGSTSSGSCSSSSSSSKHSSSSSSSSVKSADGSVIVSTVGGSYSVHVVSGAAITTPYAQVAAALGAPAGASVTVRMRDSECGPMAQKSIQDGIQGLANAGITATEAAALDIFAYVNKESVISVSTPVRIQAGLPESMRDGSQVAVILVQEGGTVSLLRDQDNDPATITVDTPGFGVFAFVKISGGSL